MPLQRIFGRLSPFSPAARLGCCLIILASAFYIPLPPALAATGPFADLAGSWSGTGTLRPSNGAAERIRCKANYRPRGNSQHEIDLDLSCVSDSYKFELTGQFTADERNEITGSWNERSRNIGGTVIGSAHGDRVDVHVESSGFAADLTMLTRNRRQSVTIDSHGGGQIVKASITLNRS
jgi:hypothetical protein